MIEQYFRSGIRLLWNKPQDSMGAMNGDIVASVGVAAPMTYDGLDGHAAIHDPIFTRPQDTVSNVIGLTKGDNIPYAWLDYAPGRIARLPVVAGTDVLSGYMSGCLIARGTHGGELSAFHVGTITDNADLNRTVKRSLAKALPDDATGFYPNAAWAPGDIATIQGHLAGSGPASHILALVTGAGAFHSILVFAVRDPQYTDETGRMHWCVGGVRAVPAMNRVQVMASLLE